MKSYEDLEIYQDAFKLAKEVHFMSLQLPHYELYELGSQIRRSAQSVRTNIVEGYGRRKYKADFEKFLTYSDASLLETKSQLKMIYDLYHPEGCLEILINYEKLGKQLNKFIEYVNNNWNAD
jgi:four helix bundle protein